MSSIDPTAIAPSEIDYATPDLVRQDFAIVQPMPDHTYRDVTEAPDPAGGTAALQSGNGAAAIAEGAAAFPIPIPSQPTIPIPAMPIQPILIRGVSGRYR